jgi:hypothetical protein
VKNIAEAERHYKKALELDPEHAQAHFGLAQVWLARRRNFQAAGSALTSVGLLYHNPAAHFCLGVALHRLGTIKPAVEAFRVTVAQSPSFLPAHRRLAIIYENRLKDPKKAAEHRKKIEAILERHRAAQNAVETAPAAAAEDAKPAAAPAATVESAAKFDPSALSPARTDTPFAIIVSGLPRSGTSLMMQMLIAGGIPALHDGHRPADADNPRGYFEFAPAKNLRADCAWLPHARGRALKLVAQLLPFLPPSGADPRPASAKKTKTKNPENLIPPYRIIFMERSLDEVLASQDVMLARHGRKGAAVDPGKLRAIYEQQLAHVNENVEHRKLPVLRVKHADCLRNPAGVAARVKKFLELPLDEAAMSATVETALYRQRG